MMKKTMLMVNLLAVVASCGNNNPTYDATGTFEATEVTVSAQNNGQLVRFDVEEGTTIAANAQVGKIDDVAIRLKKDELATVAEQLTAQAKSLSASRGATDSRQLELSRQEAAQRQQLANLQKERRRYAELVGDGAVPRKQLDEIDYQISVLQKQLDAFQEQLSSNNASLQQQASAVDAQIKGVASQLKGIATQQAQLDRQLGDAIVTAPIAGVVLEKYAERGEYVTTGKPLFRMADTTHMVLRAYVTSAQLKDIKVGQAAQVYADYGDGQRKSYKGTVTWISDRSEFTPKTILTDDERADLVYAVKVAIANDGMVKIGMYGEVKF